MNYNTVYVGMDVHKESFSLCSFTIEEDKASHAQKVESDYKQVLKYLDFLRTIYGNDANFVCGYEAGCLGFTLYHQLTDHNVNCVILAPATMLLQRGKKKIKTDKRDAALIGSCLAQHNYNPVHVSSEEFREHLSIRHRIEEKNGELKTHGLRRADSTGLFAMQLQMYFTAFVVNAKRIAKLMAYVTG